MQKLEKKEPIRRLVIFTLLPIFILLFFFSHPQGPFSYYSEHFGNGGQKDFRNKREKDGFPLPLSEEAESSKLQLRLRRLVRGNDLAEFEATGFACDVNNFTEVCVISEPVIFDKQTRTIYVPSNDQTMPTERLVKPYPRREDPSAMEIVTPVKILRGNYNTISPPACQFTHNVPALLFSFAGFLENPFHAFNEIVIPLFLTSRHFESQLQFVFTEYRAKWAGKYTRVMKHLSSFDAIVADDGNKAVHCFPAAVVGLRYHDNLAVNISEVPEGYTMASVREFLWEIYNVKVKTVLNLRKPKLLLVSRRGSRTFLNEDEMVNMMEEELGLEVYRASPNETSRLDKFAQIVNSCEIMVGAHGAGLTNGLFLPTGAVMIQIVPLGLNWASDHYFGEPAPGIGLSYLRYKVWRNETSLYEIYGPDNPIVSDPASIWAKGYMAVKEAYVDTQNFRINLARFKGTLLEALKLLEQSQSSP